MRSSLASSRRLCTRLFPRVHARPRTTLSSTTAAEKARKTLYSPVTWLTASATLAGLYALYQVQYRRQLNRHRVAGRPDLGGKWSLLDTNGNQVDSKDLLGKWVLLYFGFTKCPDVCPQEMEKITAVLQNLDRRGTEILPVFITIDPARDTAERLRSYFDSEAYHPRFLPLTGTFEAVRKACRAYRVYFTKPTKEELKSGDYLIDHSIISYLLDPEGNFQEYFGKSLSANEMETKLQGVISNWEQEEWMRRALPFFAQMIYGKPLEKHGRSELEAQR